MRNWILMSISKEISMKSFILLFLSVLFFISTANAGRDWEGTYELDNGLTITRKPTKIQITSKMYEVQVIEVNDEIQIIRKMKEFAVAPKSRSFEFETYEFRKGNKIMGNTIKETGLLSLKWDQKGFQAEASKLGEVKSAIITEIED